MGNCCSNKNNVENTQISLITQNQNTKTSSIKGTTKVNFALKLPHGFQGIEYSENDKRFISCNNINTWLKQFYILDKKWDNWVVYNDEIPNNGDDHFVTKKGHCKGIITWNENRISWLCHSVPKFPSFNFDGKSISDIREGELIYGQSFQYMEFEFKPEVISSLLLQLHIMEANIYIHNYDPNLDSLHTHIHNIPIRTIQISDSITHIAKSPKNEIDIYSEHIILKYNYKWQIETWIRGHHIEKNYLNSFCSDIHSLIFENIHYKESQDHSKWAVSNDIYYFIGDLNRMTSQYKRGGGGFICNDIFITKALQNLIQN